MNEEEYKELMRKHDEFMKTQYTDEIVCPICFYKYADSWEYEDEEGELNCQNCNGKFRYSKSTTIEYCTEKIDEQ